MSDNILLRPRVLDVHPETTGLFGWCRKYSGETDKKNSAELVNYPQEAAKNKN